jgi:hypothetical protein
MDKTLPFNGRLQLHCVLRMLWLARDDASVTAKRRATYATALGQRSHVPLLALDTAELTRETTDAMRQLVRYVQFQAAHPEPYAEDGLLYGLLVHARENGLYDHFMVAPPRLRLAELYMVQGAFYAQERVEYSAQIEAAVAEWRTLDSLEAARLRFRVTRKLPGWQMEACGWARYMQHCLFDAPQSRLHGRVAELVQSDRFRFVPLDPDTDDYDWEALVLRYMEANPQPAQQTLEEASLLTDQSASLPTLPYPERLLDRRYMSLAALDVGGAEPVMAGYLVCSARPVRPAAVRTKHKFPNTALQRFVTQMLAEKKRPRAPTGATDCGYDLFSIDAVHTSLAYRGTPNLAGTLALLGVELARQSHRLLGFSLLISQSAAAATRTLLTRMGFAYYNRENALKWLTMAFKDFHTVLSAPLPPLYPSFGTPVKALTLPLLVEALRDWVTVYKARGRVRDLLGQWSQYDAVRDREKILQALPVSIAAMETRWRVLDAADETLAQQEAVKTVLGGLDPDDTFLYLDKTRDDAALFAASDDMAHRYSSGEARVGQPLTEAEDGRMAVEPVPRKRRQEDAPDDEDLALYAHWLQPGARPGQRDATLLYLEMAARNTRPGIHVAAPWVEPVAQPALLIVPSYRAPRYAPVLFCVGDGARVFQVSFAHDEAPLTREQSEVLALYDLAKAPLTPLQLPGDGGACRALALVARVLERLQDPSSERELQTLLREPIGVCAALGYDALDAAWLAAIKWARASQRSDERLTLVAAARNLYDHVRQRYEEKMLDAEKLQSYVERTLENILEDYRFCVK